MAFCTTAPLNIIFVQARQPFGVHKIVIVFCCGYVRIHFPEYRINTAGYFQKAPQAACAESVRLHFGCLWEPLEDLSLTVTIMSTGGMCRQWY